MARRFCFYWSGRTNLAGQSYGFAVKIKGELKVDKRGSGFFKINLSPAIFILLQTHQQHIMKNKSLWILIGLLLVILGFTAIILQMIGTQWVFLSYLEIPGRLFAFLAKIVMVIAGFIIIVLARTDWEQEREDSSSGQ